MKIEIVYEKADILKLVVEDLLRKGIKVKVGHTPLVKAPLEVKLSVDTEDVVAAPAPPPKAARKAPRPAEDAEEVVDEPAPEPDMADVLNRSQNLTTTQPGKFPTRQLGPNESYDFPKG